ncbi:MAG: 2-amino-3,7-dideoxy-D-threo-hept-6-ulosonate synthase [Pseudomonadota bacterium]
MINYAFGRQRRLHRLYRHGAGLFTVPLDHSVSDGPIVPGDGLNRLVGQLVRNGVDAVVLHKGRLRYVDHCWFKDAALIVHLSASTSHAPDPDAKYLVASVEEALRHGADAVSVHVNLGSRDESRQIADLATVSNACSLWNVPLMAMMYPRGPRIDNPRDPDLVAHAVSLAADFGADIVKAPYVGDVDLMMEVIRSSPIPVLIAGGPLMTDQNAIERFVCEVMMSGAVGVAMGRNVFQASDPGAMARKVSGLVHSISRPAQFPLRSGVLETLAAFS